VYLPDFLIGTGGWAYFKVPNKTSLKAYSELFNFVEVNNTFYHYPTFQTVRRWREIVPNNFTFSVRCHHDLTHNIGFIPSSQAFEIFYQMRQYCDILNSPYLVLETPATYLINKKNEKETRDFFSSLSINGLRLVWEIRAPITQTVVGIMEDFGIIHCVDLSKQKPSFDLDVTYSRLFGKGQHNLYQFNDDELVDIERKAQDTDSKTIILSYHGARMNSDAARFKHYKRTGNFLPVTAYTGIYSAQAVLSEDITFPISKAELKAKQGWKVVDLTPDRRVHLSGVLANLPEKTYSSLDEVIKDLRTAF
jgi:uncharacterized protein YecE (DUF72 family)